MKKGKQKLLMLGLDAALPSLILKFTEEGSMPVTKKLMDRGWFSPMMTTFPPLTAAAWGAITCGAGPGTAGIPSLMVHMPGEPLDKWHTSFCRNTLRAETLWEAAEKDGPEDAPRQLAGDLAPRGGEEGHPAVGFAEPAVPILLHAALGYRVLGHLLKPGRALQPGPRPRGEGAL